MVEKAACSLNTSSSQSGAVCVCLPFCAHSMQLGENYARVSDCVRREELSESAAVVWWM